jgi:hypothetical protein
MNAFSLPVCQLCEPGVAVTLCQVLIWYSTCEVSEAWRKGIPTHLSPLSRPLTYWRDDCPPWSCCRLWSHLALAWQGQGHCSAHWSVKQRQSEVLKTGGHLPQRDNMLQCGRLHPFRFLSCLYFCPSLWISSQPHLCQLKFPVLIRCSSRCTYSVKLSMILIAFHLLN